MPRKQPIQRRYEKSNGKILSFLKMSEILFWTRSVHSAVNLPGLNFPNVRDMDVKRIWFESEGFNRYRGHGWMKEPCQSCPEKEKDHGGCRCQAFMLTGDAAAADPVCDKSPRHDVVLAAVERAQGDTSAVHEQPLVFRTPEESRRRPPLTAGSPSGSV